MVALGNMGHMPEKSGSRFSLGQNNFVCKVH